MTRFYSGPTRVREGPAIFDTPFQMSVGQLAVIKPKSGRTLSSSFKRAIREVIRRRTEATDFLSMTNRQQNLIIKALISRLTKGAIDSIEDLSPQTHIEDTPTGEGEGQEGYTHRWTDNTWQCVLSPRDEIHWGALAADLGNVCLNWGVEYPDMVSAPDLAWKFKWRHEAQAFHVGTAIKGFEKTGTPGPAMSGETNPRPVQVWGRNRLPSITAMNPFAQKPGQWTNSRQIPHSLLRLADAIADKQEPFAEARSRSSGDPSALSAGIRGQTFEFSRGPPRKTRDHVKTKNPSKPTGNEGKKVIGIAKGSLLGKLLNATTEGLDIWNVAYDALPASVKPRGRTSQLQRIELVIKNVHRLNLDALIEGLIINEIEDIVFGTIGGAAAKVSSRVTARPTGELVGLASSRGSAVRAGR